MNNPIIYQICLGVGIISTGAGILMVIPEMAKSPALTIAPKSPAVAFPSNSELRAIKTKDGQNLAVVKTWGYVYNPMIPPSTDLKILQEAMSSNGYSLIILESDSNPAVLGWYLQPDLNGNWQLYQITEQFKNQYKELFPQ